MNRFTFALSYWDPSTNFVGLLRVDAISDTAENASRGIESSKLERAWLLSAFTAAGLAEAPGDIDGITVGEHMLVATAPQLRAT